MALRAGYYGLKKSAIDALKTAASMIAGMANIKTIGDGLTLSDQGELAANIDSDTMEFKDHKLAAKIPESHNYVCDELYRSLTYSAAPDFTFPSGKDLDSYDQLMFLVGGITGISSDQNACPMIIDVGVMRVIAPYSNTTIATTSPHIFEAVYTDNSLRFTLNENEDGLIVNQSGNRSGIVGVYGIKY